MTKDLPDGIYFWAETWDWFQKIPIHPNMPNMSRLPTNQLHQPTWDVLRCHRRKKKTMNKTFPPCLPKATNLLKPPRPKPQNLGGLVGGEAEFDPLGFSDTFDVRALDGQVGHGEDHRVLSESRAWFWSCLEEPQLRMNLWKHFVSWTNWCFYLELAQNFSWYE